MTNNPAKTETRKPPSVSFIGGEHGGKLSIGMEGDCKRLIEATGNTATFSALVGQAALLGAYTKATDADATNAVLGFVDAMEPRDPAEALLLAQMAAIHQHTFQMARRLNHCDNIRQQDAAERALNKLARTFSAQMETLKRYRHGGKQVVRVERVTVESGGQAIVGEVSHGGRVDAKT
ncbi:hypothetical protein [Lentibacter sp.]|uniref:hypothetical protein n=1 Tax=Lentibacter sp. TaxID=2024994 RepID=UPI003F6B1BA5